MVCAPFANCTAACASGDDACFARCVDANPLGTSSLVAALEACLAGRCESPCNLSCGNVVSYFVPPDAAATCSKCVAASGACEPGASCGTSTDCLEYGECLRACGPGLDCTQQCAAVHEAGAALAPPFTNLFVGNCATPCQGGNWWYCAGNVTPPNALASSTTVTLQVQLYPPVLGPAAGVLAEACAAGDLGCATPLSDGGTDEGGFVPLPVPQQLGGGGFDGYYRLWSPDGGVVPELLYISYPIREATFLFTDSVVEPLTLQGLLSNLHVTQAPGNGYVGVIAYDCANTLAPNVQISTDAPGDAGVQVFYQQQGQFSAGLTTDPSGLAVLTNVPVGTITVMATPAGFTAPVGHLPVNVEQGKLTIVALAPD